MNRVRTLVPYAEVEQLLRLNFGLEDSQEFALVWWLAAGFMAILNLRSAGKRVDQYLTRTQLEAKVNLVCETRFDGAATLLENFLFEL